MQPLSAEELAAAVGGTIVQHGGADRILGVSTDSRTLQPGELFVPIIGERFDAHRFIGEAVRKGHRPFWSTARTSVRSNCPRA